MRLWPLALVAAAAGLALAVALTAGPDPGRVPSVDEVAGRMMSPFCPGLTLAECPSDQSARVRSEIGDLVDGGATNAEIDRWIVDNFGEVALGRPAHPAAWLVPPLLGLGGLTLVLVVLQRRVRRRAADPPPPELSEEDEALVDRDFAGFHRGTE